MADKEKDNPDKKGLRGVMNALFADDRDRPGAARILQQELARPLKRLDGPDIFGLCMLGALGGGLTAIAGIGVGAGIYEFSEPADDLRASQTLQGDHAYSAVSVNSETFLLFRQGADVHLFQLSPYQQDNKFTYVGQAFQAQQRIAAVHSALASRRAALISVQGLSIAVDEGHENVFRYYQTISDEGRQEGQTLQQRYADVAAFWSAAAQTVDQRGYGFTTAQREALPDRGTQDENAALGAGIGAFVPLATMLGLWGMGATGRTRRRRDHIRKFGYDRNY